MNLSQVTESSFINLDAIYMILVVPYREIAFNNDLKCETKTGRELFKVEARNQLGQGVLADGFSNRQQAVDWIRKLNKGKVDVSDVRRFVIREKALKRG